MIWKYRSSLFFLQKNDKYKNLDKLRVKFVIFITRFKILIESFVDYIFVPCSIYRRRNRRIRRFSLNHSRFQFCRRSISLYYTFNQFVSNKLHRLRFRVTITRANPNLQRIPFRCKKKKKKLEAITVSKRFKSDINLCVVLARNARRIPRAESSSLSTLETVETDDVDKLQFQFRTNESCYILSMNMCWWRELTGSLHRCTFQLHGSWPDETERSSATEFG